MPGNGFVMVRSYKLILTFISPCTGNNRLLEPLPRLPYRSPENEYRM